MRCGELAMRVTTCVAFLLVPIASPGLAQNQVMCGPAVMAANAGRDVEAAIRSADQQGSPAQQGQAYQDNLRQRREQAEQYAAAARNGVALPPGAADSLRNELKADIEQWRAEFRVSRKELRAMRDHWLVAGGSLTAAQWAQRRVDWWATRDEWVAHHLR
jgi:hypothetical protein